VVRTRKNLGSVVVRRCTGTPLRGCQRICALHAHSGSCPPESSRCVEARIVFQAYSTENGPVFGLGCTFGEPQDIFSRTGFPRTSRAHKRKPSSAVISKCLIWAEACGTARMHSRNRIAIILVLFRFILLPVDDNPDGNSEIPIVACIIKAECR